MKKHLGVVTSFLFICATALCWAGCSDYGYSSGGNDYDYNDGAYTEQYAPVSAAPVVQKQCAAPCQQPCAAEPCGDRFVQSFISCDGVKVTARQPRLCMLGDQNALDITVEAFKDVCEVNINTNLPDGVVFVRSDPEAQVDGQKLAWHLPHMNAGECRHLRIFLRCEREGELCTCFCVTATPVAFCTLLCAKPVLTCHKCGPEEACPGDCLEYQIEVSNTGSCVANDVVVTDNLPVGLEHASGQKTLAFRLGDVWPCQTKRLCVPLRATECGRQTNAIVVTACNAAQTSCECTTLVCKYCCDVVKEGPKEVKIGQNADYKITVTNTGDKSLTGVAITDTAPNGTSIVSADGANIQGLRAVWNVAELKAGEKVTVPITLTTCSAGYYVNRVHVTDCQNCTCCGEFATRWKGVPALQVCVVDMEDPICVGESTSYRITIANSGSEIDNNVRVTVRFPSQLTPTGTQGASQGQISGQTVTFAPYSPLNPRQTIEYRIDARAVSAGDARVKVEIASDSLATPIVQEESTIVN